VCAFDWRDFSHFAAAIIESSAGRRADFLPLLKTFSEPINYGSVRGVKIDSLSLTVVVVCVHTPIHHFTLLFAAMKNGRANF